MTRLIRLSQKSIHLIHRDRADLKQGFVLAGIGCIRPHDIPHVVIRIPVTEFKRMPMTCKPNQHTACFFLIRQLEVRQRGADALSRQVLFLNHDKALPFQHAPDFRQVCFNPVQVLPAHAIVAIANQ